MSTPEPQPNDREARIQRLLRQFEAQLRQHLPEPDQTLEQIEQQVVDLGRQLREVIERETLDAAGHGHVGTRGRCRCGRQVRFVRLTPRTVVTLNGEQPLQRAYYYCRHCQRGFCPLDQQLQLGRDPHSVGVRALTARFASYLPGRRAAQELTLVTGIPLSARSAQREAVAVGQALAQEWQERETRLRQGQALPPRERPAQAHATMDEVKVRIGKEWKGAKVGAVYRRGVGDQIERCQYYATLADSQGFGLRLRTLAQAEGLDYCRAVAVVGDGADWVWQESAKHFPRSTEILDFYHLLQHLWEIAREQQPEETAARAWIELQVNRLEKNEAAAVRQAVAAWEPATAAAGEVRRKGLNYLDSHAGRMAYQTYAQQGFHIGSGVVEAACKNVVQMRMKGPGMRWSRAGAEAMLHLRAAWCSTGATDFLTPARRVAQASHS